MDKVLNEILDVDTKIRVINICEFEFGDNNRIYKNTEEDINEMLEDLENPNIYDIVTSNLKPEEIKDFMQIEGNSFSFIDGQYINEEFMKDIRQNISHPEIKNVIQEELEVLNQSTIELISHIEKSKQNNQNYKTKEELEVLNQSTIELISHIEKL